MILRGSFFITPKGRNIERIFRKEFLFLPEQASPVRREPACSVHPAAR
jgi:hypothetical protein